MARDPAVTLYYEENPHEEKSSGRREFFSLTFWSYQIFNCQTPDFTWKKNEISSRLRPYFLIIFLFIQLNLSLTDIYRLVSTAFYTMQINIHNICKTSFSDKMYNKIASRLQGSRTVTCNYQSHLYFELIVFSGLNHGLPWWLSW